MNYRATTENYNQPYRKSCISCKHTHEKEHYKAPEQPQIPIIDPRLWKASYETAQSEIRPNINKARTQSRLQQYFQTDHGASSEFLMTQPPTDLEISKAIKSMNNRKPVGADGITAEVIKQNQEWIVQNIQIILHNCQQSYPMTKQWLKGIMTFIPKQRKDRTQIK